MDSNQLQQQQNFHPLLEKIIKQNIYESISKYNATVGINIIIFNMIILRMEAIKEYFKF